MHVFGKIIFLDVALMQTFLRNDYLELLMVCMCENYYFPICTIYDALRDFVPFLQFKKREKHSWRSVNFSKVATLLKLTLLHERFSRFLHCTNGTKTRNAPHIRIMTVTRQVHFLIK